MKLPTFAIDARLFGGTHTGDSTYWSGLIRALAQIESECQFLLYSNTPKPENIPGQQNIQWVTLPAVSSRWWSLVQFPLAARKANAQVIHSQYSLSPLVGKIGITTIHDVSFLIGPEWFSQKDRTLLKLGVTSAAKRARAILAVSHTDREEILSYLPSARGKVSVTTNACPDWIQRTDAEYARAQVKKLFGIDGPYLLTVGTRWPRKNMELAVAAVKGITPDLPHKLILTGKGSWNAHEMSERSLAVGYVSNEQMGLLYSGAAMYVAPSRHEGFGIPLLEAFRCGCPVLCSSGGALPEVAGEAAYVESSWSPGVWTATLERLLSDSSKLETLSRAGIEREKRFTWTEMARQTLDVYLDKDRDRT